MEPTASVPGPEPPAAADIPKPAPSLFDRLAKKLTEEARAFTGGRTARVAKRGAGRR
jgi:hypothetical protein